MAVGAPEFAGFRPAAFAFFRELNDNNDPAWFKPRKALYEAEVLEPFRELIAAVGDALGRAGLPLIGDPRRGIFRIYRDVRFSPDKRLYKTHAGAVLTRSGNKRDPGVLYLHVAPGESMVAAGFWHPEAALLTRLRRAVLADTDGFLAIVARLAKADCPLSRDDKLSRPPGGFFFGLTCRARSGRGEVARYRGSDDGGGESRSVQFNPPHRVSLGTPSPSLSAD